MMHNEQPKPQRLLTASEAAKILNVSPAYVYQLMARGMLSHVKIGRSVRLKLNDLNEFIEWQTRKHQRD